MAADPRDQHDDKLDAYAEAIREKARLRDETTYKSPVWHRLQAEVDQLTEEMLDYQQRVPELRAQERRGAASCLVTLLGLALVASVLAGCLLGWWSWWWSPLAVVGIAAIVWRRPGTAVSR